MGLDRKQTAVRDPMSGRKAALFLLLLLASACGIEGREEYNAGVAAWEAKNDAEAIIQFQAAVARNPDLGEAHQGLAECYVKAGRYKEARDEYLKAKKLYDQGVFQDTAISNEKKKARVDEQLDWVEDRIASDEKSKSTPSAPKEP